MQSLKFDDIEKANILQSQFKSVFVKEPGGEIPKTTIKSRSLSNDLNITDEMVKNKLLKLNTRKSFGPDEIHPRLVKELTDHIARPIASFFNQTLADGVLPRDWEKALVSAIYKNGSRNVAETYRPISLTSILSKMVETFIREKIMKHLIDENLLSSKQYGFISGRSTTLQLLNYIDKCVKTISEGGCHRYHILRFRESV